MNKHSDISVFAVESTKEETWRFADWPLALKSILGFWLVYFATVVVRAYLSGDPTPTLTISDDQKTIEFSGSVGGGGEASGVIHC